MYDIHDDYRKIKIQMNLSDFMIPILQFGTKLLFRITPNRANIRSRRLKIAGYKGHKLPIELFTPDDTCKRRPCILFIHGGGFILNASAHHKYVINDFVETLDCVAIFVDYSLAPQFPYPHGLEDCYACFKWIHDNAENLHVDPTRIGVYGDSAGGALAAGLCHMARDRRDTHLRFQMLIYPVTDSRMQTDSMKRYTDTPAWNAILNKRMWELYLPQTINDAQKKYAAPLLSSRFEALPPAYIEVAEFDCLHDEGILYHQKLIDNGIPCRLNEPQGTIHGFEVNYRSEYTLSIIAERLNFAREMLQD